MAAAPLHEGMCEVNLLNLGGDGKRENHRGKQEGQPIAVRHSLDVITQDEVPVEENGVPSRIVVDAIRALHRRRAEQRRQLWRRGRWSSR